MAPDKAATSNVEFTEDFFDDYANFVYFEASVWDLKLIFGQIDQSGQLTQGQDKIKTIMHGAVTVPWAQAKLMLYWLKANIEAHEMVNGTIPMPQRILPVLPPIPEEVKKADPNAERVYDNFKRLRDEFVSSLK